MQINKGQLILIGSAIVLTVLLIFANTTPPAKEPGAVTAEMSGGHESHHSEDQVKTTLAALPADKKAKMQQWEERAKADPTAYDSLVKAWADQSQPAIAAMYAEKAAEAKNTKDAWFYAGKRYYTSVGFVGTDERGELYASAIRCLSKAQALDPSDLDIKTHLAACYVEGTAEPMKGIGMLREVVQKDSANVSAQLQLAFFSIKSNQLDKAIMRFKKVIELDPHNLEVYLYLADVYEKTGDKGNAIRTLEKYRDLVTDNTAKTEVQGYIDKLKKQ